MALKPTGIRFDAELHALTKADADRLEIPWSEWVRQACAMRLAWSLALLRADDAGMDPGELLRVTGESVEVLAAEITRIYPEPPE